MLLAVAPTGREAPTYRARLTPRSTGRHPHPTGLPNLPLRARVLAHPPPAAIRVRFSTPPRRPRLRRALRLPPAREPPLTLRPRRLGWPGRAHRPRLGPRPRPLRRRRPRRGPRLQRAQRLRLRARRARPPLPFPAPASETGRAPLRPCRHRPRPAPGALTQHRRTGRRRPSHPLRAASNRPAIQHTQTPTHRLQ